MIVVSFALGFVLSLAIFVFALCVGSALKRLGTQQIREIHTPSQLTHRQPGSISERSGKGDEAAFHEDVSTRD